jgi:hypothetical protein
LASNEIVNHGVEVGGLFGGLAVRPAGVAEIVEHNVHRDIGWGLGR